jgi:Flp pilus assembly protein TadB
VLISALEVKQKIARVIGKGQWTPLEVGVWLSALIITITLGVLVVVDSVSSWVVVVPGAMGVLVALWRYRVETERKRQSSQDQSE